jgi:hypothetical protein
MIGELFITYTLTSTDLSHAKSHSWSGIHVAVYCVKRAANFQAAMRDDARANV